MGKIMELDGKVEYYSKVDLEDLMFRFILHHRPSLVSATASLATQEAKERDKRVRRGGSSNNGEDYGIGW
jgi:hypothetical protein